MLSVIETTASTSIVAHPSPNRSKSPCRPPRRRGWRQLWSSESLSSGPSAADLGRRAAPVLAQKRAGPRSHLPYPARPTPRFWEGGLSPLQWIARVAALLSLVTAIVAGRLGVEDELDNLAPALIVGAAWPLLILCSCFGPIWRWLDPWDGATRPFDGAAPATSVDDVRIAAVLVLPWVWYLSAFADPLDPRSVGAALGFYTILTLAGVLASGRVRWLSSAEPFGILLSWLARLPRGRLVDWTPPRGAQALLGGVAGGVLFGAVRRSELWGE